MSIHTATSTSKAQSIDNVIAQPPPLEPSLQCKEKLPEGRPRIVCPVLPGSHFLLPPITQAVLSPALPGITLA